MSDRLTRADVDRIVTTALDSGRKPDLRGANLQGANLRGAKLRYAELWGANLWGADLRDANLRDANLRGANLRDANLWGANLWGADLRGADLCGADPRYAILRDADLRYAILRDADLRYAILRDADLRGANLWGCRVDHRSPILTATLPSGHATYWPTLNGWEMRVGCWTGTADDLHAMITNPDSRWPEAEGAERDRRRPYLAAWLELCAAHRDYHDPDGALIRDLHAKWGDTDD